MGDRKAVEIKIPPDEARRMGQRLLERINHSKLSQRALALQLGCSPEMVNKMVHQGGGSFAGWRKASQILRISLDYLAFGKMEAADQSFTAMLRANQELTKAIAAMRQESEAVRAERDRLLDQLQKLRMLG